MSANSQRARRLKRAMDYLLQAIVYRNLSLAARVRGDLHYSALYRQTMRKFAMDYRVCADLV